MNKAFTLIEILVAATIFLIVITAFLNLFVSAFHYQKQASLEVELLNNASYVSEYISRALRMARKDLDGDCVNANYNYKQPSGITSIQFLKYDEIAGKLICQRFFLQDNQVKVRKSSDETEANLGTAEPLTPSNFIVNNLKFNVLGDGQGDGEQPKITFVISPQTQGPEARSIDLQITVCQRQLDVSY